MFIPCLSSITSSSSSSSNCLSLSSFLLLSLLFSQIAPIHAYDAQREQWQHLQKQEFVRNVREKLQKFCPTMEEQSHQPISYSPRPCPSLVTNRGGVLLLQFQPIDCVAGAPACYACHPAFEPSFTHRFMGTASRDTQQREVKEDGEAKEAEESGVGGVEDLDDDLYYDTSKTLHESKGGSLLKGVSGAGLYSSPSSDSSADPALSSAFVGNAADRQQCYNNVIATNSIIQHGIKKHIGICRILQELVQFYFLYHPKVIGLQTDTLRQHLYAGNAAMVKIETMLAGVKVNLLAQNAARAEMLPHSPGPVSMENMSYTGRHLYNSLLFAMAFILSETWETASSKIKLNAHYQNSASFLSLVSGEAGTMERIESESGDSLLYSFFLNYIDKTPIEEWDTKTSLLVTVSKPVDTDPFGKIMINGDMMPMSNPQLLGVEINVCPLVQCLLESVLTRIGQSISNMESQRQHYTPGIMGGQMPIQYYHLKLKFVTFHSSDGQISPTAGVATWAHRVTVIVNPPLAGASEVHEPYASIVWMDGNVGVFLFESDEKSSALDKLKHALSNTDWVTDDELGGKNPLQDYFAPGMLKRILHWARQGTSFFEVKDAVQTLVMARDNPDYKDIKSNRLFLIPGVEIHAQSTYFRSKTEEFLHAIPDSSGSGFGTPVELNSFLNSIGAKLHAEETDLFLLSDQPTYAMRSFFLSPEIFAGYTKQQLLGVPQKEDGVFTMPSVNAWVTTMPFVQNFYGLPYTDALLGDMEDASLRTALERVLVTFGNNVARGFKSDTFFGAVGSGGVLTSDDEEQHTAGFVQAVHNVKEFVETYSTFYRRIVKDRCGLLVDDRKIGEFLVHPQLDQVVKFVNMLAEVPKTMLQVSNFFSPAGVQFLSIISSATVMKSISKDTQSGIHANIKEANWDSNTLFAVSARLALFLADAKSYLAKVFSFNTEVRRSHAILNFISYFKSFAENLKDEIDDMKNCLTSPEVRKDSVAAQSVFFFLKYWHDQFYLNLRLVSFYSTPVVEGCFQASARVFSDPSLVRNQLLKGMPKSTVLASPDMTAPMFTAWHSCLMCEESKKHLQEHLPNNQFVHSIEAMVLEQQTFMATISSRIFRRSSSTEEMRLANLEHVDQLFLSLISEVLTDPTFLSISERRYPVPMRGAYIRPRSAFSNSGDTPAKRILSMAPFAFPNLRPVMKMYRNVAIPSETQADDNNKLPQPISWKHLMSAELQKFMSVVSSTLYMRNIPKPSKLIQSAFAFAHVGKASEDALFYKEKLRLVTLTYISALKTTNVLLKDLPKESPHPEVQDLLLQMHLLANHASIIHPKLVEWHTEFEHDRPVELVDGTGDELFQSSDDVSDDFRSSIHSRMSMLYMYTKYLYDAFSFAHCAYHRLTQSPSSSPGPPSTP
eukprot:Nk52_evm3s348 gene=Nk52_evmTU3s348